MRSFTECKWWFRFSSFRGLSELAIDLIRFLTFLLHVLYRKWLVFKKGSYDIHVWTTLFSKDLIFQSWKNVHLKRDSDWPLLKNFSRVWKQISLSIGAPSRRRIKKLRLIKNVVMRSYRNLAYFSVGQNWFNRNWDLRTYLDFRLIFLKPFCHYLRYRFRMQTLSLSRGLQTPGVSSLQSVEQSVSISGNNHYLRYKSRMVHFLIT